MKNMYIPKKFFIVLLIFALAMMILGLFAGCVPSSKHMPNDDEIPQPVEYIYYKDGTLVTYRVPVIKFEYNGHQYIRFGEYQSTCVVHDPDCKCHKKQDSMFNW